MKNSSKFRKPIQQAFQYLLANQRGSKNMSQNAFSKKCGFTRQYISLVESGKRMPSFDFAINMAEVFGINTKEFILLLLDRISYYENH
ncbi:MAG: helix-turn-helix transcriptional regulator [Fibromonadales bacterium]|nr:helix-turn-helix transcriptional regulator [Fibromonadales bacterium]